MAVLDLSPYKPVPATLGDANQIANGFQAIQACINALDNNNFAAGKIFDPLKLMQDGAIAGQGLEWSAAANGGTGGWVPAGGAPYRKTTAKQVVNTVVETDLLNGEITVAAGLIGASGVLRLTAWGDWKQNSGAATDVPRLRLKLGATTLLDTNIIGALVAANSASRQSWQLSAEIVNLGAANSQWVKLATELPYGFSGTTGAAAFAVGEGVTTTVMVSAAAQGFAKMLGGAAAAVDTTVAQLLALTVVLPAANANVDMTLKGALVEIL